MATITPTITTLVNQGAQSAVWAAATSADTSTAVDTLGFRRGSVQFDGTFGGATIVLQGSNDNTNFATLNSATGAAITTLVAGIFDFNANCRYIRPAVTGGAGTSLNARVIIEA